MSFTGEAHWVLLKSRLYSLNRSEGTLGCGCNKPNPDQNTPVLKKMVSEETITKENEIEIHQRFADGSERKLVIKRRNVGVQRKLEA